MFEKCQIGSDCCDLLPTIDTPISLQTQTAGYNSKVFNKYVAINRILEFLAV